MNIVIVGAGEVGRHLATSLSRQNLRISVIESDAGKAAELEREIDAKVVAGDGTSVSALAEANIGECELFLALTSENTVNLMSASMAKAMGVPKVLSRVHPGLQREEWLFDYRSHFGIDHIFSSERLAAIELAKFIRNPRSLATEEIAMGKIELQQLYVSPSSPLAGKKLSEVRPPKRTRVAMIQRGDKAVVPSAETELKAGDKVTIFGEPRNLRDLAQDLMGQQRDTSKSRVVIFGGGEYGFALAQMLESWDCEVRIFERNPEVCEDLAHRLSHTVMLNADATSLAELEEEQVGDADFFVATSTSDEDNVMSCLQANSLGTKSCLTLIHREDYAQAISASGRHFGILAAVSPRETVRKEISRYLTSEKYRVMKEMEHAQLIEVQVREESAIQDKEVRSVKWPDQCVLVGQLRGNQAWVPGGDDVLEAGDELYAMVSEKGRKAFLKLVL